MRPMESFHVDVDATPRARGTLCHRRGLFLTASVDSAAARRSSGAPKAASPPWPSPSPSQAGAPRLFLSSQVLFSYNSPPSRLLVCHFSSFSSSVHSTFVVVVAARVLLLLRSIFNLAPTLATRPCCLPSHQRKPLAIPLPPWIDIPRLNPPPNPPSTASVIPHPTASLLFITTGYL